MNERRLRELIEYKLKKSDLALRQAENMQKVEAFRDVVSRAYFSMLEAAEAYGLSRSGDAGDFSISNIFDESFMKQHGIPQKCAGIFRDMSNMHLDEDSVEIIHVDSETSGMILYHARDFTDHIRSLLK